MAIFLHSKSGAHAYYNLTVMLAEPQGNTQLATGVQGAHTLCFWKGLAGSRCAQGTDEEFSLQYYARII